MQEDRGNLPHISEAPGGSLPNPTDDVGNLSQTSAAPNYRVTVQEATRMLEEAGVPRTERTVISWCHKDAAGKSKLDAMFSVEERRHLIDPGSLETVIEIERLRQHRTSSSGSLEEKPSADFGSSPRPTAEDVGRVPKDHSPASEVDGNKVTELEQQVLDLTITNKGKDYLIDTLKGERAAFLEQLQANSREIGQLETKLLALSAPQPHISIDEQNHRTGIQ